LELIKEVKLKELKRSNVNSKYVSDLKNKIK
jgi:hypothetical protein